MNANIYERANQQVRASDTAYLGVIDESGYPSVSAISPIKTENILEVYFSTNIGSNKEKRLRNNNRASVCFHAGDNNVTLVGETEIITDQETKSRFWLPWFKDIYTGGETDPDYIIVKFTTKRVSLWIGDKAAEFAIDDFLTVQSRCGILCNGCPYQKSHGCTGCIALRGKPFWGECPIAKCCQDKGLSHCGECLDIPCEILREFSCGEGEHCDKPAGARIAVCIAWAGKKEPTNYAKLKWD